VHDGVDQRQVGERLREVACVHFDLQAADVAAEADRLTRLGAKQIRSLGENNNRWISFIDPEGKEFDLVAG
jgi:hypothetical protein